MIIITAQEGVYSDVASAEWNGTTYSAKSSHGVTMALARKLVAAGCPDQPWQMAWRSPPCLQVQPKPALSHEASRAGRRGGVPLVFRPPRTQTPCTVATHHQKRHSAVPAAAASCPLPPEPSDNEETR